jgi:hypothetical protein
VTNIKKYRMVTERQKKLLKHLVRNKKMLIREAAFICDIGYENAKIINSVQKPRKQIAKK